MLDDTLPQVETPPVPSSDRDALGRFQRGNAVSKLGGRPRGYDLKALAAELSEKEGLDLPMALWRVLKTLLKAAEQGDVSAAKLVLDKLAMADVPLALGLAADVPISDTELVARVRAIAAYAQMP